MATEGRFFPGVNEVYDVNLGLKQKNLPDAGWQKRATVLDLWMEVMKQQ